MTTRIRVHVVAGIVELQIRRSRLEAGVGVMVTDSPAYAGRCRDPDVLDPAREVIEFKRAGRRAQKRRTANPSHVSGSSCRDSSASSQRARPRPRRVRPAHADTGSGRPLPVTQIREAPSGGLVVRAAPAHGCRARRYEGRRHDEGHVHRRTRASERRPDRAPGAQGPRADRRPSRRWSPGTSQVHADRDAGAVRYAV